MAPRAKWPTLILLGALIVGMSGAAWNMATRGVPSGPRDLMILAPEDCSLSLDEEASRIPVAEGVHAFGVVPGEHRLQLQTAQGTRHGHTLQVPPGIGPLMIEVRPSSGGTLEIGYY